MNGELTERGWLCEVVGEESWRCLRRQLDDGLSCKVTKHRMQGGARFHGRSRGLAPRQGGGPSLFDGAADSTGANPVRLGKKVELKKTSATPIDPRSKPSFWWERA
jgi:hypothetical protein